MSRWITCPHTDACYVVYDLRGESRGHRQKTVVDQKQPTTCPAKLPEKLGLERMAKRTQPVDVAPGF